MSKRSTGSMASPLLTLSPNKGMGMGSKSRRFRVKEGEVGGKRGVQKNLFSPSACASTNDNTRTKRKRSVSVYAELSDIEDDASVVSEYSCSGHRKKPRAQSTKKKRQKRKTDKMDESIKSKPPAKKKNRKKGRV